MWTVTFMEWQEMRFPKIHLGKQVSGSKWAVVRCPNCHPSHKDTSCPAKLYVAGPSITLARC